jgi:hypothetical protein
MEEVSDAFNYFYYYKTSFLCLVMDSVPPWSDPSWFTVGVWCEWVSVGRWG